MNAVKLGMIFTVISICFVMTGCSTVSSTVFAESKNKYTVVATGQSTDIALHRAYKEAEKVCAAKRQKTVVIVKKTIQYQAMRRDLSATNHKIADIASATGEVLHFPNLSKEDDYESTMLFECQGSTIQRCNFCFPVAASHRKIHGYS